MELQIHAMIGFSAPLGSVYSGVWTSARELCVTIDAATELATTRDTKTGSRRVRRFLIPDLKRVLGCAGRLVAFILPSAGFMSVHGRESPMQDSVVVTGTWGAFPVPKVLRAWTQNLDGDPYAGIGDKLWIEVWVAGSHGVLGRLCGSSRPQCCVSVRLQYKPQAGFHTRRCAGVAYVGARRPG